MKSAPASISVRAVLVCVAALCIASSANAATESVAPATLSLEQAIRFGVEKNLATLLAAERSNEARGIAGEANAPLMPRFTAVASQYRSTVNLRAQGIDFPGLPLVTDPFSTFDARARLVQTVFNLGAWRQHEAAETGVELARLQESLARQQVASGVTLSYVEVLRAKEAVAAAQSNVELATALKKLADDQHDVGVASGIDVARAATRLAENQVALISAQGASERAMLDLQRLIGAPQDSDLVLSDSLRSTAETAPAVDNALAEASSGRYELRIAQAEVARNDIERRAALAGYLPTVALTGDYGASGNTPTKNEAETYRYGVQLEMPIFDGGITRGRVDVAASRERQAELQLADLRHQVEQDVRLALVTLKSAGERMRAAQLAHDLAERELQLARDRFAAGAADNIEVVNAQTVLAISRDGFVNALAAYNAARVNLAAALGQAEQFRL